MACQRQVSSNRVGRWWFALTRNAFAVGLLSLVWFLFRTGTKPSRAAYPCQRAAAVSGYAWLATYVIPLLPFARSVDGKRISRRNLLISLLLLVALAAVWGVWSSGWLHRPAPIRLAVALTFSERTGTGPSPSELFVVQGVTPEGTGIPDLIALMSEQGPGFYASGSGTGIVRPNDVVVLKVNGQWNRRGGTNTDLLKAVIRAIVDHPAGFTGEIVVADNGQAQFGSLDSGGSLDWSQNNAEDQTQSVQDVVDAFARSHAVSAYLWDDITWTEVQEYNQNDTEDGYVVVHPIDARSGSYATYPKFRTENGTFISLRLGVWDPIARRYDSDRLKLINMPILKPHSIYGVTGCVKHYMGVTSDYVTSRLGARAHYTIMQGGMGTVMAGTRYPDLNILDAIWVSLSPGVGPSVSYSQATRLDIIAASTDPVALDYWAAKYILMQGAEQLGRPAASFDPDRENSFAEYLRTSAEILMEEGFPVTYTESMMSVHVSAP